MTIALSPYRNAHAQLRGVAQNLAQRGPDRTATRTATILPLVSAAVALSELPRLDATPSIRTLDASGRLKLSRDGLLSDELGWQPGCLAAQSDGSRLVLTQPEELVGVQRARHSHRASFSRGAREVERVGLAPAHVARVGQSHGRDVLVVTVPERRALLLANPLIVLSQLPPAVSHLLTQA